MTIQEKIVEIAAGEVGVREIGGNNNGAMIREYQAATWLKPSSWPWCAAFTCWVLWRALNALGLSLIGRCRDASAFGWERWARSHGHEVLPETAACKAGDFVIFDFSHIGIVEKDSDGEWIDCIEGNTNGKGERDSEAGDGVWRKRRHRSIVKCFIRLKDIA